MGKNKLVEFMKENWIGGAIGFSLYFLLLVTSTENPLPIADLILENIVIPVIDFFEIIVGNSSVFGLFPLSQLLAIVALATIGMLIQLGIKKIRK